MGFDISAAEVKIYRTEQKIRSTRSLHTSQYIEAMTDLNVAIAAIHERETALGF
jgi:hypothetical protein